VPRGIAWSCFFLSGAAGLIYEVCWIRRASLVFGSTIFALSTVLAMFFLGLALGSAFFGRVSQRLARPLRTYALLEVGLAALALTSVPAFEAADRLYGIAYRSFGDGGGGLWLARIGLVALVLLPPTFLMGGTLPLFCRQFVVARDRIASPVGFLYALNTLGAAAGCAAAGFVLIPKLGVRNAILVGAALNLAAAVGVSLMRVPGEFPGREPAPPPRRRPAARREAALVLAFLAGFVALGNEVLWTRYLGLLVRNTITTYTVTLTVVLLGIVLGSALASRFYDRTTKRAAILGVLHVLSGLLVLALMTLPAALWKGMRLELSIYVVLLLPPAVLSGASFPLLVRLWVDDPSRAGAGVGRITAFNTLGGIVGSLGIGLVALPVMGLQRSLLAATALSLATGFVAWWVLDPARRRIWVPATVATLTLWFAIPKLSGTRVPADFLADRGALVEYREGLQSNLAVVRDQKRLVLEIDRWWQGENRKTHQIMAAHLPMLLHPRPRRVLVVGVGVGQTASRMAMYDIERLDAVDIEPVVFDLIRSHFETRWLDDPRTRVIREDGRNYLMHTDSRYDVISLEVGQIFRPGVASFYTEEFYRRARERLAPGGVLSQFVPLPFLSRASFQSLVRTFLEVFPQSTLWYNTSELLLLGWNGDSWRLDPARLRALSSDSAIRSDLSYSHWGGAEYRLNRPSAFLASFLSGPGGLRALAAGAPILHDDRPVLEYETARVNEFTPTELAPLAWLKGHLEPIERFATADLPADTLSAIRMIRDRNLADIEASASLRRVDLKKGADPAMLGFLAAALRANPENAQANRLMGYALVLEGRLEEARPYFVKAVALRPDDAAAELGLAFVLHRLGRVAEAVAHYRQSLVLDPDEPEAHNGLGAALAEQGSLVPAIGHFEQALRLRPDYAEARRNLEMARAAGGSSRR